MTTPPYRRLSKTKVTTDAILTALRSGRSLSGSAELIGISRSALYLWRRTDPAFDVAVEEALREGAELLVRERLRAGQLS